MTPAWPFSAAHYIGVLPRSSAVLASTSPWLSRILTNLLCPFSAAHRRGVWLLPYLVALGSTSRRFSRSSTLLRIHFQLPKILGSAPSHLPHPDWHPYSPGGCLILYYTPLAAAHETEVQPSLSATFELTRFRSKNILTIPSNLFTTAHRNGVFSDSYSKELASMSVRYKSVFTIL